MSTYRLLSIDAWRDINNGWTWNNWHAIGSVPMDLIDKSPRQVFAYLRAQGFLSPQSAGRVAMHDDQYNIVITERGTGQPLFAIEYGAAL